MNSIIRLRGNASSLVWPDAMDLIVAHISEQCHTPTRPCPLCGLQREAARTFAAANGWRYWPTSIALGRLEGKSRIAHDYRVPDWTRQAGFDHTYSFSCGNGVAVSTHPYGELRLEHVPVSIIVDQLPKSWWRPGATVGYVLRPPLRMGS